MTKIRIKGLNKEMSTTGTGASFAPGTGAQYASPKSFKKKDEIGEPFTKPNPSTPNRKSKFVDYKQLFEKAKKALKFNPITDFSDSQAWAGDNTGYDMDTQDAASVLELAKTSKKGEFKIGDVQIEKGTKYVVKDINPVTGAISWSVEDVPAFDSVYKEFDELRKAMTVLDQKTNDEVVDDIAEKVRNEFNRYRTHIRNNYPDAYKRFQTQENIDPKSQAKHKGKSAPFGSAYEPVNENLVYKQPEGLDKVAGGIPYRIENGKAIISLDLPDDVKERIIKRAKENGYSAQPNMGGGVTITLKKGMNERLGVSKDKLNNIVKFVGAVNFTQMIISLRDENVQDEIVSSFEDQYPAVMDKRDDLQEVRYSRFKKEAKLRTPTEQIHRAVREIRQRMNEMLKIVGHTERMKNELKQSNEGMSYLKRTKNALGSISEKLQELTNRIKGLTE